MWVLDLLRAGLKNADSGIWSGQRKWLMHFPFRIIR
jgi:hypothetical protein